MGELIENNGGSAARGAPESEQLLTFILDGQEYGVDILRVQEIRGWSAPMPIPNAPPFIKGVINIRGDVVPIADLRERLGIASLDYGQTTVVIVLRVIFANRERIMGVIVDAMSDVTNVPVDSIKPPPSFHTNEEPLARGIATLAEKMITILDVDRIFSQRGSQSAA